MTLKIIHEFGAFWTYVLGTPNLVDVAFACVI